MRRAGADALPEDGSVNATNGHEGPSAEAAVTVARPVVLVATVPA
ncbi:MAG: hypothetical protein ACRDSF_09590 [Pseudonocardiaceae bacterium]